MSEGSTAMKDGQTTGRYKRTEDQGKGFLARCLLHKDRADTLAKHVYRGYHLKSVERRARYDKKEERSIAVQNSYWSKYDSHMLVRQIFCKDSDTMTNSLWALSTKTRLAVHLSVAAVVRSSICSNQKLFEMDTTSVSWKLQRISGVASQTVV